MVTPSWLAINTRAKASAGIVSVPPRRAMFVVM
ncbi:Uncharacterised protein [Mycobacterium tuberculosis]|nr:Uncharacterised protein [Mycobacterium tuberculosis]